MEDGLLHIDYLYIAFKNATLLPGGVALSGCGTWELRSSFRYLSKILTNLHETYGIQSQFFNSLHVYHF